MSQVANVASKNDLLGLIQQHQGKPIIVQFFSNQCGPCQTISPEFIALSASFPNMAFARADVNTAQELAKMFEVTSIPAFHVLKNGVAVDKLVGANRQSLIGLIQKNLGTNAVGQSPQQTYSQQPQQLPQPQGINAGMRRGSSSARKGHYS